MGGTNDIDSYLPYQFTILKQMKMFINISKMPFRCDFDFHEDISLANYLVKSEIDCIARVMYCYFP